MSTIRAWCGAVNQVGGRFRAMSDDEVRWLDATESQAWRGFLDLHAHLRTTLNRDLQASSGLSMAEYDVLVQLTDVEDGRRRAFELGDRLGWEKSRLSKQVIRMEQRGLVVREVCEEDRRGAYVAITAAGRKAIEDAAPRHVEVVRRLFLDPLARPQVESLAAAMAAILAQGEQTG